LDISVEGGERERGIRKSVCFFLNSARGENFFKNQRGEKNESKNEREGKEEKEETKRREQRPRGHSRALEIEYKSL